MTKKVCKLCLVIALAIMGCKQSENGFSDNNQTSNTFPKQLKQVQDLEKTIVVSGPNELKLELIYIKPGRFTMGRGTKIVSILEMFAFEDFGSNEGPPRKVTITMGFYIGKYEITVGQYCKFLNSPDVNQPEKFIIFNQFSRILKQDEQYIPRKGTENCTVNTVPWTGANAFCQWLSKNTDRCFRLPTEAEWEFTARGPEGRYYPWGDANPEQPWWVTDEGSSEICWSVYSIAERFPFTTTPDGVVGMAGIGEWVSDYYDHYPRRDEIDPTGPKDPPNIWRDDQPPGYHVLRGSFRRLTEREFGADDDYGTFRVLMEVSKDQNEQGD